MSIHAPMDKKDVSPFKLNLPTNLKNAITEQAKRNNRSLSGEIIARLELSLSKYNTDADGNVDIVLNKQDSAKMEEFINSAQKLDDMQRQLDYLLQTVDQIHPAQKPSDASSKKA